MTSDPVCITEPCKLYNDKQSETQLGEGACELLLSQLEPYTNGTICEDKSFQLDVHPQLLAHLNPETLASSFLILYWLVIPRILA
jgi:hypothetical protein